MGIAEYLEEFRRTQRFRSSTTNALSGWNYRRLSGSVLYDQIGNTADGWGQETVSLNNPRWHERIYDLSRRDVGGPFYTRKVTLYSTYPKVYLASNSNYTAPSIYRYIGILYPNVDIFRLAESVYTGKVRPTAVWQSESAYSKFALRTIGTQLALQANPFASQFRSADSLAEIFADQSLMGIPMKDFLEKGYRGLAGEYLNLQFAILPTISDAQKLYKASQEAEAIMAQFLRDSDRRVVRRRTVPTSIETTSQDINQGLITATGSSLPATLQANGSLNIKRTTVRDVWFEGVYESTLRPQAADWYRRLRAENAVYGFLPNPKSLWEATPFSWLIDYFTNAQEFIHGMFMAGIDGSVLVRGYVMATSHVTTEYTWTGDLRVDGTLRRDSLSWKTEEVIKQREKARPYGIGFTGEDLSVKQLSILAALGISRFG